MKLKICQENQQAEEKLPPAFADKSGIGVHYMDAYIKPLNTEVEGMTIKCKRRGLKVTLTVQDQKGDGLMRRLDVSSDPKVMLQAALKEAAEQIGYTISVENGEICLEAQ